MPNEKFSQHSTGLTDFVIHRIRIKRDSIKIGTIGTRIEGPQERILE